MGRNLKGNKPEDMVCFKLINSGFMSFVDEEKSQDRKHMGKGFEARRAPQGPASFQEGRG